ncbi:cytochrome P450 [Thermocrispum sp.]|nr:cytochrome P450 [Thermocrispum sp.]
MKGLDLLGPEMTEQPHPYWAQLRREQPVCWDGSQTAWLITRYEDVRTGLTEPQLFSSNRIAPLLEKLAPARRAKLEPILSIMRDWMVVTDPPAHTRLRTLANAAFRGQRIAAMKNWIAELVDGLLDEFVRSGNTDFMAGVAYPLPATVIARMLGAPQEDRDRFQRWSDELALVAFGAGGEAREERHERALRGVTELQEYLRELIATLRKSPGDDMISFLLGQQERLDDDELLSLCTLILFAGHETTTNLLCNSLVCLTQHPDQLEELRADPSLVPNAVEEVLRYEGPIKILVRWVTEDVELHGQRIRSGDRVYLVLQSANRDERVFDDPETFDIRRPTQPVHLGFGRGPHTCLGAQLARLEVRIALPRILERLPGLRLAGDVTWKSSVATRVVEGLQVDYDSRREPAPAR